MHTLNNNMSNEKSNFYACLCKHTKGAHHAGSGECFQYDTQEDKYTEDLRYIYCGCTQFKLNNLDYLEQEYEARRAKTL